MASQYEPGNDDLKAAYRKTGLALVGIGFEKAMAVQSIRTAITCKAKRVYLDAQKNGKPAPIQLGLI